MTTSKKDFMEAEGKEHQISNARREVADSQWQVCRSEEASRQGKETAIRKFTIKEDA
ncbi:MAG: hypothetical protein NW202_12310 [Nitrospira sp.]|nr:hypothetical protein [Nitrospira sp.]